MFISSHQLVVDLQLKHPAFVYAVIISSGFKINVLNASRPVLLSTAPRVGKSFVDYHISHWQVFVDPIAFISSIRMGEIYTFHVLPRTQNLVRGRQGFESGVERETSTIQCVE